LPYLSNDAELANTDATIISSDSLPSSIASNIQPTQSISATNLPSASNQTTKSCTVRCPNGCSYPGGCRRYYDGNKNGKCDLGECL
jgi:hypothetical protein